MEEIWKDIICPRNYVGLYQISNLGRIKSLDRTKKSCYGSVSKLKGMIRTPILYKNSGYLSIILSGNGRRLQVSVHRLVAVHFIPNPENKPCVNHKNGQRNCNNIDNLEWVSYFENYKHSSDILHTNKKSVPVIQMDLLGNIVNRFRSISDVESITGYDKANIHKAIKCGGVRYKYRWIIDVL